ncbi:MAG TPA: hypothetical protein VFE47_09095 [Tepidisphaeraceae bacterium]|jgi:hypothetical protein|nr:hypothetical protein [Tepidisphaeraceae bacterium]
MKQAAAIFILASLLLCTAGSDRAAPIAAANAPADVRVRFVAVGVFIDPHGKPLACYQVKIIATGDVKLVGIEGGDADAYNQPPYYDPRALQGNQIILGAYSLGGNLPVQNTRVATLMFRVAGNVDPAYNATLDVAGTTDATPIAAAVTLVPLTPPVRATNEPSTSHGDAR